ncbi:MAG TPA: hypothetical protein VMZ31_16085 [Phycisphaerae bacterium]|nr:hypothetical protein [Phycisphaerae bacterium]
MSGDALYTIQQTMERLAIGEEELKQLIKNAKLHMIKNGAELAFRAEEVDQVLAEREQPEPLVASLDDTDVEAQAEQEEDEPISLTDEPERKAETGSKIRSFGEGGITAGKGVVDTSGLKRSLLKGAAATRCRAFHAKLSDAAVAYMNNQINEWVDSDPEIEIKFATSTIGVFEGKHAEQNLIITIFY